MCGREEDGVGRPDFAVPGVAESIGIFYDGKAEAFTRFMVSRGAR